MVTQINVDLDWILVSELSFYGHNVYFSSKINQYVMEIYNETVNCFFYYKSNEMGKELEYLGLPIDYEFLSIFTRVGIVEMDDSLS